jgi:cytochrome bd-type quinol oxidase subunit 2
MAVQSTSPPTGSRPGIAVALHLLLRLLALLVFARAVFAGLFLDGNAAWRQWHAVNGMLLIPLLALLAVVLAVLLWRSGGPGWIALASLALLLAIVVQNAMGQTSQVAVHVPLGVAIPGLIGALLGRTRNLAPSAPQQQRR